MRDFHRANNHIIFWPEKRLELLKSMFESIQSKFETNPKKKSFISTRYKTSYSLNSRTFPKITDIKKAVT
ncbi:MAG: hypothetical protein RJB36_1595 [Bacteroidota bacterium]